MRLSIEPPAVLGSPSPRRTVPRAEETARASPSCLSSGSAARVVSLDRIALRRRRAATTFLPRTMRRRPSSRYVGCVAAFTRFFGRCPSRLGPEEIRQFRVHLTVAKKLSFTTLNQTVCALRFLYRVTLRAQFPIDLIPFSRREHGYRSYCRAMRLRRFLAPPRSPNTTAFWRRSIRPGSGCRSCKHCRLPPRCHRRRAPARG